MQKKLANVHGNVSPLPTALVTEPAKDKKPY
jgi:hypothetical protein